MFDSKADCKRAGLSNNKKINLQQFKICKEPRTIMATRGQPK